MSDGESVSQGLSELAARFGLVPSARDGLQCLLAALSDDPLAPTAIRDPRRVLREHLADSLVALELSAVREAGALADIGAGAGIPGLPLALALPGTRVWLVESAARAFRFIERIATTCEARNAVPVHARVEDWRDGAASCDVVTARALAAPAVVAEYAAPLLRLGGTLVMWRGKRDDRAEMAAARAAPLLGLEAQDPVPVLPYEGARHRHLYLMVKVADTPPRFPRRPGIARKRPLGYS